MVCKCWILSVLEYFSNIGVWTLTKSDVECISIGAGILGCGGGGDPNIGRVIALQLLQQGKKIQMVNPCRYA